MTRHLFSANRVFHRTFRHFSALSHKFRHLLLIGTLRNLVRMSVEINPAAYLLALLHAHKYSSTAVAGVFLGSKEKNGIKIRRAVPLNHGMVLSPLLEASFPQIEEHAKSLKMGIVGCYFGNEARNETELSPLSQSIGQMIQNQCNGGAAVLLINNKKLQEGECAFDSFVLNGDSWTQSKIAPVVDRFKEVTERLKKLVIDNDSQQVVDFLDHLNDLSCDWTNEEAISSLSLVWM